MNNKYCSMKELSKKDIFAVLVIVFVAIVMLSVGWLKWGHPIIDCGREVYIPWQILAEGKVLYRDFSYYYSPLAPYLTAFWFKLFGIHLYVHFAVNIIISLIMFVLLYLLSRNITGPWISAIIVIIFAITAALSPNLGSYEGFIFPYSMPAIYGLLFFLFQLLFMTMHLKNPDKLNFLYISALFGALTMSSKQEFALSALLLAFFYSIYLFKSAIKHRVIAIYWAITIIIPSIIYSIFLLYVPLDVYLRRYIFPTYVAFSDYGKSTLVPFFSFQHLGYSIECFIETAGIALLLTAIITSLIYLYERFLFKPLLNKSKAVAYSVTILIAVLIILQYLSFLAENLNVIENTVNIVRIISWMPVFISIYLAFIAFKIWKKKIDISMGDKLFILFALASIALAVRCYAYCFTSYLIAPSFIVIIYLFTCKMSEYIESKVVNAGKFYFKASIIVLIAFILAYSARDYSIFAKEDFIVTSKYGNFKTFRAYAEGYNAAIKFINENLEPEDQFTAFPEETLLNFLTRHPTPTQMVQFMDINTMYFSVANIDEELQRLHKSKYLFISNFPYFLETKYYFGVNYHNDMAEWINKHYTLYAKAGKYELVFRGPLTNYGFMVYKRNK